MGPIYNAQWNPRSGKNAALRAQPTDVIGPLSRLNALEVAVQEPESAASELRWQQAEEVARLLDAGMSQRDVAAGWLNRDGEPYSHRHVGYVAKTWRTFGNLSSQDRPAWNAAYNSPEVRKTSTPPAADTPPPAPAPGTYSTIVIDPPWRYSNVATRGAAEDHYPTMSLEELVELHIPAADNAHLYLWVTNGFLREAFGLLDAWGFTYKACLTWCKPQIGMGNYFRNATEHVYFAIRGSLPTNANNISTWFVADRTRHSAKPDSFYDIVERSSPGPYIDMFHRGTPRFGWSVWGNES